MDATEVRRLDPATRADFWRVHAESEGCGWCYCVAWWVSTWDGWGERTDAQNREFREELFARGEDDGYVLYVDGEPAGWCQCGPRDRLAKLVAAYGLQPDPRAWAITCFVIRPAFREHGHALTLLRGVVADLGRRGVVYVQGFPRAGDRLEPGEAWRGTVSLFAQAGSELDRETAGGPVMVNRSPGSPAPCPSSRTS